MTKYLTTAEAAELLSLKPKTLEDWRWRSCGPPFVRFGRLIRYRAEDLDQWATENLVQSEGG